MPNNTIPFAAICLTLFAISCSKQNSSQSTTPPNSPPNTPPALAISQFSPQKTSVDSVVTIMGAGFSDTASKDIVTFNDTVAVVQSATTTQLVVVVPKGAATGRIRVEVDGQLAVSAVNFIVGDHWTLMKAFQVTALDPTDYYFNEGSNFIVGLGDNSTGNLVFTSWQYSPSDGVWKQVTSLPTMHDLVVASFSISGVGYVLSESSAFWKYDTISANWIQLDSFPIPEYLGIGMTAFCINGKGYLGLGQYLNMMWQYDPVTDSWKEMGNFPGTANTYVASFVVGSYGYVGTGSVNLGTNSAIASFYQYDPSTDTWTQKADFPGGPRSSAAAFSIGNMGYFGTGLDINGRYQSDFWQYDPSSDSWTRKSDFGGGGRFAAAAFSGANQGYMGFGQGDDQLTPYERTNVFFDLWQYQP